METTSANEAGAPGEDVAIMTIEVVVDTGGEGGHGMCSNIAEVVVPLVTIGNHQNHLNNPQPARDQE